MKTTQDDSMLSAVKAAKASINKIEKAQHLNSVVARCDDLAFELAKKIDDGKMTGKLKGLTILLKDNVMCKGVRIRCCSKAWDGIEADTSSAVADRLINEGAVIVGVANMDEFAMGNSNLTSSFGGVVHPLDNERAVGGSSGGSAAAVAAGLCFGALGTDTGGSIRQPASYCGVTGLKPSHNAIGTKGVVPLVPEYDVIGPIAKTVADCALMFEAMSGREVNFDVAQNKKLKVGIIKEFLDFMNGEDRQVFETAKNKLIGLGHEIVLLHIPGINWSGEIYEVIGCSGSYESLKKLGVDFEKLGAEAKSRTDRGLRYLENRELIKSIQKKEAILKKEIAAAFEGCDFMLSPAVPSVAFRIDEADSFNAKNSDYYLRPFNISGHPALTVSFCSINGLPIGVQIIGKMNDESMVFSAAKLLME